MDEKTDSRAFATATIVEAFEWTARRHPDRVAMRENGGRHITWGQWVDLVDRHRTALARKGVKPGDTAALQLGSSLDTYLIDMAVSSFACTPFSVYVSASAEQLAYQLETSGATVPITEAAYEHVARDAVALTHEGCTVLFIDPVEAVADLLDLPGEADTLEPRVPSFPSDVATLIFTSGTTGDPKAAELTHGNIMAALRSSQEMVPLEPGCRLISYFPPAHVADRVLAYYYSLVTGATIPFLTETRDLISELPDARPNILLCVPRSWELLQREALRQASSFGAEQVEEALVEPIRRASRGLAPIIVERLAETIALIGKTTAILLVEQNLSIPRYCANRVVVLENSRIVASGDAGLLDSDELVSAYLGI